MLWNITVHRSSRTTTTSVSETPPAERKHDEKQTCRPIDCRCRAVDSRSSIRTPQQCGFRFREKSDSERHGHGVGVFQPALYADPRGQRSGRPDGPVDYGDSTAGLHLPGRLSTRLVQGWGSSDDHRRAVQGGPYIRAHRWGCARGWQNPGPSDIATFKCRRPAAAIVPPLWRIEVTFPSSRPQGGECVPEIPRIPPRAYCDADCCGGGAILASSAGPVFTTGFVHRTVPRKLSDPVPARESVIV